MNIESDDTPWHLLPHDPEGFFGLEPEYDLKTLKRSYNKLLRRFKPERFPEQFQKIRAAFDQLNDALRYGQQTSKRTPPSWPKHFDITRDTRRTPNSSATPESLPAPESLGTPEPYPTPESSASPLESQREEAEEQESKPIADDLPLHEQVQHEEAASIYRRLRLKPHKSAYEYFALATLSDVVDDESTDYLQILLEGIEQHPRAPQLAQLLREYLAEYAPVERAAEYLLQAAAVVKSDRFYYLTERLWDRLLRERPFAENRETLAACERHLLDHRIEGRLAFYLHVLKQAMFTADEHWLDQGIALLDENFDQMPRWAEEDHDTLELLRKYRQQREAFCAHGLTRERIDTAIVAWCEAAPTAADRAVIECHLWIAGSGERWLADVEPEADDLIDATILWERIAADVLDRLGDPGEAIEADSRQGAIESVLYALESHLEKTGRHKIGVFIQLFAVTVFLWGVFASLVRFIVCLRSIFWHREIWRALLNFAESLGLFVLAIILGLVVYYFSRGFRRLPEVASRNALMKLLQLTSLRPRQLADEVEELDGKKVGDHQIDKATKLAQDLRRDVALHWYGLAQKFVQY